MGQAKLIRALSLNYLVAVLPAAVAFVLSLLLINPFLSDFDDDARYMILAQSLATGQGFSVISEPGSPADKLYPFGYPLLLVLPTLVMGGNGDLASMVAWLKILNSVLFAGSALLAYRLAGQPRSIAFASSILMALSLLALRFSSNVMSEVPFLFLSLVAIALLHWTARGHRSWGKDALAGIALAGAFYLRTIGVALIVAGLLFVALRCGLRRSLGMVLLLLLLMLPWLYQQTRLETSTSYSSQFARNVMPQAGTESDERAASWMTFASRLIVVAKGYVVYEIPKALFPHISDLTNQSPLPLAGGVRFAILLILAVGWLDRVRAGPGLAELYVVISLAALSFWWEIDRFLVPLVPFLTLYLVTGVRRLVLAVAARAGDGGPHPNPLRAQRAPGREREQDSLRRERRWSLPLLAGSAWRWGLLLLLPFVVSPLLQDFSAIRLNMASLNAHSPGDYYTETKPDYANYFRAAEWLRDNSPADSVVMGRKPYVVYVYSGRLAVSSPETGTAEDVLRKIEAGKIDYVIEDDIAWANSRSKVLASVVRAYPDRFVLAYSTAPPITRVWRLRDTLR